MDSEVSNWDFFWIRKPYAKSTKEKTIVKTYLEKKIKEKIDGVNTNSIPSIENFQEFKLWLLKKLNQLENLGERITF